MKMEKLNIVNIRQASMYIKNGVKPVDVYYTDKLVFVFKKSDTEDVFKQWRNYALT